MAVLNSNPEVLLRKRKGADRKRIQRADAKRALAEKQSHRKGPAADKFVRAETLAIRNQAAANEAKRVESILKHEAARNNLVSAAKEKEPHLAFVIRIETLKKRVLQVPKKAENLLQAMRLTEPNLGVFVKVTPAVEVALKLVSPYIVVGSPSLASVRLLFQKRAEIPAPEGETTVKLDNNQAVEDKFGDDLGFVCIEDLVHELVTLGDNFKDVTRWLAPFPLKAPAKGWGAIQKLERLRYAEDAEKTYTLAGHAKLEEVDIDKFIEEQN